MDCSLIGCSLQPQQVHPAHWAARLMALRQPMAAYLRFITSPMKIVTDLERMGNEAVNIAERVVILNLENQIKPYIDIPRMAEITQSMVRDVLGAFVNRDSK